MASPRTLSKQYAHSKPRGLFSNPSVRLTYEETLKVGVLGQAPAKLSLGVEHSVGGALQCAYKAETEDTKDYVSLPVFSWADTDNSIINNTNISKTALT